MMASRYSKSRQKACQQCVKAKTRCDLSAHSCNRCANKGFSCVYNRPNSSENQSSSNPKVGYHFAETLDGRLTSPPNIDISNVDSEYNESKNAQPTNGGLYAPHNSSPSKAYQHFSDRELICPINAQDISNRWLNAYIPGPEQTLKEFPSNVASFMSRILKSYAAAIVHGKGVLPFIHHSQMTSLATNFQLSACLSLVRMCTKPVPGAHVVVANVLECEMNKVYGQYKLGDGRVIREAFQAYLIYAMVLYFCLDHDSNQILRQTMMNLQELACASSQNGLVCLAEQEGIRPSWEAWIAAETQRRTLYSMYLFDNLLSVKDGLPTYLGIELRGLPAPASKTLWRARNAQEWAGSYNIHLAEWATGGFRIDELWPPSDELNASDLMKKSNRTDAWLEDVDEFGTMLYAVTCCTHGA